MVGVARLRTRARAGVVVTLRHAEMLNPDGTIYTKNLRGAAATDVYVSKGGEQEWQPAFTFHGFRYVELTGLEEPPQLGDVEGVVLGSDLESTGTFTCSDERLNQLQSNIAWGLRGNYLSIPTDCPQRDERMGWMADAQVFTPTAAFHADNIGMAAVHRHSRHRAAPQAQTKGAVAPSAVAAFAVWALAGPVEPRRPTLRHQAMVRFRPSSIVTCGS